MDEILGIRSNARTTCLRHIWESKKLIARRGKKANLVLRVQGKVGKCSEPAIEEAGRDRGTIAREVSWSFFGHKDNRSY